MEPENQQVCKKAGEKAMELFNLCDKEGKGFINKLDIRRLGTALPEMPEEQILEVFDSLDTDGNGFLTPDEFCQRFASYLGIMIPQEEQDAEPSVSEPEVVENAAAKNMLEQLGATKLTDDKTVSKMCSNLRKDNPEILDNFEAFLSSVSDEMKKNKAP